MKQDLRPGLSSTMRVVVDAPRTIDFLGENLRVYATPSLIYDYEVACRNLLLACADEGEDSVGTNIAIAHGGATLLGMEVEITATVREVQGRAVTFEVVARDAVEEISRGTHTRFIVEVAKLRARVAAKAAKAAG